MRRVAAMTRCHCVPNDDGAVTFASCSGADYTSAFIHEGEYFLLVIHVDILSFRISQQVQLAALAALAYDAR